MFDAACEARVDITTDTDVNTATWFEEIMACGADVNKATCGEHVRSDPWEELLQLELDTLRHRR